MLIDLRTMYPLRAALDGISFSIREKLRCESATNHRNFMII